MPITVELQEMFSYSFVWAVLAAVLAVVVILLCIFWDKLIKKKEVTTVSMPVRNIPNKNVVKQKYSAMINELEQKCREDKITGRQAHQEISKIVRYFVHELTGIKVQNYTLSEIRNTNMPKLYSMIEQCYAPEFAPDSTTDIFKTIKKARKVVEEWN